MNFVLLLSAPGMTELLLIGGVVLLLFGGKKIPELMRGLGKGIREFNDAKNGVKEELESSINNKPQAPSITQKETPTTTDANATSASISRNNTGNTQG